MFNCPIENIKEILKLFNIYINNKVTNINLK